MTTRLKLKKSASRGERQQIAASKLVAGDGGDNAIKASPDAVIPPLRKHTESYHRPLLLSDPSATLALLAWFDSVSEFRSMPWRLKWISPEAFNGTKDEFQEALAKRAYEVWVSEIMLQQTRVSTVIPYFKNWISKWPTVKDLAKADTDEVLSVWKGLGYYSRATRLHQGAQQIVSDAKTPGRIPGSIEDLQRIPGIGRYTAGAISSIAFGRAVSLLDGNVARVLSRQLGLYADVKEKRASDFLWSVADELVRHAADHSEHESSDVPGRWNQALMELGSTICTPRPKCEECPIQDTCKAYAEGKLSTKRISTATVPDIEESCSYCVTFETEELEVAAVEGKEESAKEGSKRRKTNKQNDTNDISRYFATTSKKSSSTPYTSREDSFDSSSSLGKRKAISDQDTMNSIAAYCSTFPKRASKKKPAEEECIVCIIKSTEEDKYLIEQRPAKGLLASLWQFPLITLPEKDVATKASRKRIASELSTSLKFTSLNPDDLQHEGEIGSLTHVFTHLKLTMHVHWFSVKKGSAIAFDHASGPKRKWVPTSDMDHETLSTGMRRCWELVKKEDRPILSS